MSHEKAHHDRAWSTYRPNTIVNSSKRYGYVSSFFIISHIFYRPLPKPLAKPGQKTFRPVRQNNFSMFKYAHTALSEPHLLHPNIYALLIFYSDNANH